ncbi:MAG TPA: chemotaxis protein CheW [Verrucomicrobiae bacterium]|nr:chemotaxis protein CheW [Verrucomicrobiae bacterium]
MNEMDIIIKEFLVESNENLDQLDRDLVQLEREPTSRELLGRIFRTVHSIKGATGFLGFGKLGGVAHAGENLLTRLRDRNLVITPAITTGLLSLVDAIRGMLSQIAENGTEGGGDYARLVETLTHLQEVAHAGKDPPATARPESSIASQPVQSENSADERIREASRPGVTQKADPNGETHTMEAQEQQETRAGKFASSTLRVNVEQLDSLMELVGELVLARNHILEVASRQREPDFVAVSQHLDSITSEIQQRIAQLRMQPINTVWGKFPRLVRDLAVQCGKRVRLVMHGEETELDKMILEMIQDPLTHLVRNAVDHGIESPEVRIASNKPEEGTVTLRAFHENGQVNIEISDDGGGIDVERVKETAVKKKLITAETAALLSARDLLQLIFLPGLSTAKNVTDVSGRGVGMDVVKSNIERIGGALDIQTRKGAGTTIKIAIPLTLAIVPAILITSDGESYAIPQANVVELVRLSDGAKEVRIESVREASFYRLRSELLQCASLENAVWPNRLSGERSRPEQPAAGGVMVVLQAQDRRFGLLVDEANDTQEIVVRSIGKRLKHIPVYAGATILGDGRVALILDVPGLAARVCTRRENGRPVPLIQPSESSTCVAESDALLIFEHRESKRFALPISGIARLEQLPRSRIEATGGQRLVQYDGAILPVFGISDDLTANQPSHGSENTWVTTDENIELVICQHQGRSLALAVNHIVDIVEEGVTNVGESIADGASASRIIDGRVTRVLDLEELLTRAEPSISQAPALVKIGARDA